MHSIHSKNDRFLSTGKRPRAPSPSIFFSSYKRLKTNHSGPLLPVQTLLQGCQLHQDQVQDYKQLQNVCKKLYLIYQNLWEMYKKLYQNHQKLRKAYLELYPNHQDLQRKNQSLVNTIKELELHLSILLTTDETFENPVFSSLDCNL